jgi:hypothetical protein
VTNCVNVMCIIVYICNCVIRYWLTSVSVVLVYVPVVRICICIITAFHT